MTIKYLCREPTLANMAYQKGDIKLEGQLGDLTFYKRNGAHLARAKRGVSATRIAKDPKFARTRENNTEFGRASAIGKLIRQSLHPILPLFHEGTMQTRLNKRILQVIKNDGVNPRGQRDLLAENLHLLTGFSFNKDSAWKDVYYAPTLCQLNTSTGKLQLFLPSYWGPSVLNPPKPDGDGRISGARFTVAAISLDLEAEIRSSVYEHSPILPTAGTLPDQLFELDIERPDLPLIALTGLVFFRSVGEYDVPVEKPMQNALDIIDVFCSV